MISLKRKKLEGEMKRMGRIFSFYITILSGVVEWT